MSRKGSSQEHVVPKASLCIERADFHDQMEYYQGHSSLTWVSRAPFGVMLFWGSHCDLAMFKMEHAMADIDISAVGEGGSWYHPFSASLGGSSFP